MAWITSGASRGSIGSQIYRTLTFRCLHCRHPSLDFVCVLRVAIVGRTKFDMGRRQQPSDGNAGSNTKELGYGIMGQDTKCQARKRILVCCVYLTWLQPITLRVIRQTRDFSYRPNPSQAVHSQAR